MGSKRRALRARTSLLVAGLVVAPAVGGCANGTANVAAAAPAVTSAAASHAGSATATATRAPTAVPVASAPTVVPSRAPMVTHEYDAARGQWKLGATAVSAQQGLYWTKAADDLHAGQSTDAGDTSGYPAAITRLKELVSLPDAQQSPAQNAAYHADINALNAFFNTPGLYS